MDADPWRSTSEKTIPNPVTAAGVVDPATVKSRSIVGLPTGANVFGLLNASNSAPYAGFRSEKSLSLVRNPVPGPPKFAPRLLKNSAGKVLTLVSAAGTPSQLISRRPDV